jgi:hypothetical protein
MDSTRNFAMYDQALAKTLELLDNYRKDDILRFTNFNYKDKNYLCIYYALQVIYDLYHIKIIACMPLLQYLLFRSKLKKRERHMLHWSRKMWAAAPCDIIIKKVEQSMNSRYSFDCVNILAHAYEAYSEIGLC